MYQTGRNFAGMFLGSDFNKPIAKWNMTKAKNLSYMFGTVYHEMWSAFNQDISKWNVSNVENFAGMFSGTKFNQDISGWDVSSGKNFSYMFANGYFFNKNLNNWNVSNGKDFSNMFYETFGFDPQSTENWRVKPEANIDSMFSERQGNNYPNWYKKRGSN
ncbi:BspA family leucine-rich repeat surface protein [Mycoplasma struthionis]|uniref:BspA family leucine-rich repeat surface protein n=1 Tax=Mycoplasma struthionis TaxID=538220 RepID=A0A3G8LIT8_9MOLU|nr:BspA family leucine-rich repeat surface protein [Mycoplasma struthionis]AZG68578.1 BspA family leucine-rich repeat surface protein [Mycoplasma struthionis]